VAFIANFMILSTVKIYLKIGLGLTKLKLIIIECLKGLLF